MSKCSIIAAALAALLATGGTVAQAGEKTNEQLCHAYNARKGKAVRAQLLARDVITAEEWTAIDAEQVRVGMSEIALRCARGKPYAIEVKETEAGAMRVFRYAPQHHWESITLRDGRVVEFYKAYTHDGA